MFVTGCKFVFFAMGFRAFSQYVFSVLGLTKIYGAAVPQNIPSIRLINFPLPPTTPAVNTNMKKTENCVKCRFRAKYDENPKSLLGRIWRWHINFCPGWKGYFTSLSAEEKAKLAEQYKFEKYR
jgi:hypothetical protein